MCHISLSVCEIKLGGTQGGKESRGEPGVGQERKTQEGNTRYRTGRDVRSSLPSVVNGEQWEDDKSPWYLSQACNPSLQGDGGAGGEGCRELKTPETEGWEHSVTQFMPSSVHSTDIKDYPGY